MSTESKSSALETLKQAGSTLTNSALQEWKEQGGKVLGYFYSYTPAEIITAAGLLPFRVRAAGSTGTDFSDAYYTSINCGVVRHAFDLVLQGEMGFLDGVVGSSYCDQLRRMYETWEMKKNLPYFHFVVIPKTRGELAREVFLKQLVLFKKSIEEKFGVTITNDNLRDAITLHNETRRLQRKLYELKKKKNPPLTGAETLAIMIAGTAMPTATYNQLLQALLQEIGDKEGKWTPVARLMLTVGEVENPEFVELIESQGAMVVTDSMLLGTRSINSDVAETGDPMSALATYYLEEQPACTHIVGTTLDRLEYVTKAAKDYQVDGIISYNMAFCDLWGWEQAILADYLKKNNIPHLGLTTEYVSGSVGQVKTRVQAFLETLKGA